MHDAALEALVNEFRVVRIALRLRDRRSPDLQVEQVQRAKRLGHDHIGGNRAEEGLTEVDRFALEGVRGVRPNEVDDLCGVVRVVDRWGDALERRVRSREGAAVDVGERRELGIQQVQKFRLLARAGLGSLALEDLQLAAHEREFARNRIAEHFQSTAVLVVVEQDVVINAVASGDEVARVVYQRGCGSNRDTGYCWGGQLGGRLSGGRSGQSRCRGASCLHDDRAVHVRVIRAVVREGTRQVKGEAKGPRLGHVARVEDARRIAGRGVGVDIHVGPRDDGADGDRQRGRLIDVVDDRDRAAARRQGSARDGRVKRGRGESERQRGGGREGWRCCSTDHDRAVHVRVVGALVREAADLAERMGVALSLAQMPGVEHAAGVAGGGVRVRILVGPGHRGAHRHAQRARAVGIADDRHAVGAAAYSREG